MKNLTYNDYSNEIASIVKNCFDAKEYEDTDEDTWTDRLHENIDNHQWVIYTAFHTDVLNHTTNEDYCFEQGLIDASKAQSLSDITQTATFWAMYADCVEYFENNSEELTKDEEKI